MIVLISVLRQDIVICDLYDYDNDRYDPNIATPTNNNYWNGVLVSFDGDRLLFQVRSRSKNGEIHVYDMTHMSTNVWTKIGLVDGKMDCIQVFVPCVPKLANVSTLNLLAT